MKKIQKNKDHLNYIDVYKSVRKNWGTVDPRTTVKQSDKIYKRSKAKKKWKAEVDKYL